MPRGIYIRTKTVRHSEETKKKLSTIHKKLGTGKWMKGRKLSLETKDKISQSMKGENNHFFGKHHSTESITKIISNRKVFYSGEDHYNWKGGISSNPYPNIFNRNLKQMIRERDNFTCQICGRKEEEELKELSRVLCVNHIDFDKNNCSPNNLNTLCVRCNVRINYQRDKWVNYFKGGPNNV